MRDQDSTKQAATTQRASESELNLSGGDSIEQQGTPTDGSGQPQIVTPPPPPNG